MVSTGPCHKLCADAAAYAICHMVRAMRISVSHHWTIPRAAWRAMAALTRLSLGILYCFSFCRPLLNEDPRTYSNTLAGLSCRDTPGRADDLVLGHSTHHLYMFSVSLAMAQACVDCFKCSADWMGPRFASNVGRQHGNCSLTHIMHAQTVGGMVVDQSKHIVPSNSTCHIMQT